jgi:Tol biopolymer transport system component
MGRTRPYQGSRALAFALVLLAAVVPHGAAQPAVRVSVGPGGVEANAESHFPAVSADGRFVAFSSVATNLFTPDTNGLADIFVRDNERGTTTLVSVSTHTAQSDGASAFPMVGAGGRIVVFTSSASTLVAGDTNGVLDVFVRDRDTDGNGVFDEPWGVATTRVSVSSGGAQGNRPSTTMNGGMSADGRYVVFASEATTLVDGDTNGCTDVFVHDRATGRTVRLSESPAGGDGNGDSFAPSMSGDARFVAFTSAASNLVDGDTNTVCVLQEGSDPANCFDVFVRDRDADADGLFDEPGQVTTTRVSVSDTGTQGNDMSGVATISPDGRYVAFHSWASNLVTTDTNDLDDVFVHDRDTKTTRRVAAIAVGADYAEGLVAVRLGIAIGGNAIVFSSRATTLVPGDTNGAEDVFLHCRVSGTTTRVSVTSAQAQVAGASGYPALSADGGTVVFASEASTLVANDTNGVPDVFAIHADADGDGLPTSWEVAVGLDAAADAGDNGGSGDPDGDGLTNLQEYEAGSHPRGFYTRYLAEGANSTFFSTRIAVLNASGRASVVARFLKGDGTSPPLPPDPYGTRVLRFDGLARRTIDVTSVPGMSSAEFSTVVESDGPVLVDRLMTWDGNRYGSHAETANASPGRTWYLAEGTTSDHFELFYLVQNPNPVDVLVMVTYLRPAPEPPLTKVYMVGAHSRFNIWVNDEARRDPALAGLGRTDVSAVLASTHPILVERALYLTLAGPDGVFDTKDDVLYGAGHASAGVPAPAAHWFLAEGATGPYFDEFILIANPDITTALLEVRYLLPGGAPLTKAYTLPPLSRVSIWLNNEAESDPALSDLANTAVSATVHSLNDVGVIVERAMWWPRPSTRWTEAHNSAGATATGVVWGLAEGEVGGAAATETYILVANTSPFPGRVRVTLAYEGGGTQEVTVPLPANSRTNVPVIESWFPGITGKRFGALIESLGDVPAQIVVERAMYSDAGNVHWAAGSGAMATLLVP